MGHQLIGQLLTGMGKLSPIDIDEILAEQAVNGMRFGEIAMSLGLCAREHVCDAWMMQLAQEIRSVGLGGVGIDTEFAPKVPPTLARRLGVIPVSSFAGTVVLAASRVPGAEEAAALSASLGREVRFITAPSEQIEQMVRRCYGEPKEHAGHAAA